MFYFNTITIIILMILLKNVVLKFQCTESGRFRQRDPQCQSYYLCIKTRNSFIKSDYTCPNGTIFNPSINICSIKADCIDNICNDYPSSVTKIPDPNNVNCTTFIECKGTNDRYPVVRKCETGYFNKDLLPEPGCWLMPSC